MPTNGTEARAMQSETSRADGFTLIEIMIVVSIVAVVASLALPNLLQSRERAKEGQIIASVKGLISMQELFRANDYDGDGVADYADMNDLDAHFDELGGQGVEDFGLIMTLPEDRMSWEAVVVPENKNYSGRTFYADQTGVIRYAFMPSLPHSESPALGE
jgi:prepilin-type N-terminal cleavage/methylation domain-containing protein